MDCLLWVHKTLNLRKTESLPNQTVLPILCARKTEKKKVSATCTSQNLEVIRLAHEILGRFLSIQRVPLLSSIELQFEVLKEHG